MLLNTRAAAGWSPRLPRLIHNDVAWPRVAAIVTQPPAAATPNEY